MFVGKNTTHMSRHLHNFTVIRLKKNRGREVHTEKIKEVIILPMTTQGAEENKTRYKE